MKKALNVKREDYIVYCRCIDDLVKYENCPACPHHKRDSLNFESFCKYDTNNNDKLK